MKIDKFINNIEDIKTLIDPSIIVSLLKEIKTDSIEVYFDIDVLDDGTLYLIRNRTIPHNQALSKCPYLMEVCKRHSCQISMDQHKELNCEILKITKNTI